MRHLKTNGKIQLAGVFNRLEATLKEPARSQRWVWSLTVCQGGNSWGKRRQQVVWVTGEPSVQVASPHGIMRTHRHHDRAAKHG